MTADMEIEQTDFTTVKRSVTVKNNPEPKEPTTEEPKQLEL